jgi:hypothetical protein
LIDYLIEKLLGEDFMMIDHLISKHRYRSQLPHRGIGNDPISFTGAHMNAMNKRDMNASGRTGLKASYILFFILIFTAIPCGYSFAAEEGELQAMAQFANNNLLQILNNIPIGEEEYYGFRNRDELSQATLGIPYQEYDMENEQPTGYWRVPVTVNTENRVLLRLKNTVQGWAFSGLGGAQLARNLGDHENNMESKGQIVRTGRIIRDFSMRCDYVQFNQQQDARLSGSVSPLWSASRFLSMFGNDGNGVVADYADYDLAAIKEIRLKAQEAMGYPNSNGNSGWGN